MTTHIRVLLVERNMEVAREVQRQLEDLGHIVPAVSVDGNDALVAAMMPGADAVLIDARLDGAVDSFDLAAHMRDEADLPVLFFSDRIDTDVLERAGNAGVYGVLTLPLHDTMLRANLALSVHRHQVDSELRKRERRYRLLAEYSTDMISAHTPDGRIIYASRVCAELLGYQPEELAGRDVYDAIHPDDVTSVRRAHRAALHGEPSRVAYRLRTRQGHYVWVETTCRALHDSHTGEAIEIVAVTRDISERKQMERERERIQKLESVGTLAGGIAHDFNNLLTGILGNISLAQVYCQPDDEMGELLTEAEDASLQAKALTQQLLIFAKGGDPIKKRMPLTSLLVDSTRLALKGSNVRVEFDIAKDLWPVEVDAGQFGQVLCNIVNNADQAMPGGGTLQVSATNCSASDPSLPFSSGPLVRISVHDSGIGIPEEHLPRVFDPYFTTKQRGSGLGLAVAHSVVAAHGGHIGVESCLGAGDDVPHLLAGAGGD